METIGRNIKLYRLNKGYSNKKLSELSSVARGYIVELENEKYLNPSLEIVCKLCKALEVTPNDLIPKEMYQ